MDFKPFVAASKRIPEFTFAPLLIGSVLGILFGASSLYLSLRVGMTVSASIPVAVLSITVFRALAKLFRTRKATILENNITQATGSAGESIAFGVAATMPAILILGHEMELGRTMVVAILGSLLGILLMIPLRRALIVVGHKELTFPEGTACAKVLIAGEEGGTSATTVFGGFFVGLIYKFLNVGMKLWTDAPSKALTFLKGSYLSCEVSPELLGVGYIIGPRIAAITFAGGVAAAFVLMPAIQLFGGGLNVPIFPATKLIRDMAPMEMWKSYILYIGAGAVASAGLISLFQSLPVIIRGAKEGLKGYGMNRAASNDRTEDDISLKVVLFGSILLVIAIWLTPSFHMNLLGAIFVLLFGFLFVTVSSQLCGEIGSSANPTSGMTVATLLFTSLVFLALGWVSMDDRIAALSVAAVVCVAAANGGTTSQDLKTGFLVGGTPRYQQYAIVIGSLTSALFIGVILNFLNQASTVYSKHGFNPVKVPDVAALTEMQKVHDTAYSDDHDSYHVLRISEVQVAGPFVGLLPGKYLVDNAGDIKYYVDPGINGVLKKRDNGVEVQKFDAPKARLMALIIDGILTQKLPWGLVLLGVFMAIMVYLLGVPALPFAVGVYLPLTVTGPIFCGGMVRLLVQRLGRRGKSEADESDSGPGVLYASGLIAGGSIAGIGIALFSVNEKWVDAINVGKYFPGLEENLVLPCVLFVGLAAVLYRVAVGSRVSAKRK